MTRVSFLSPRRYIIQFHDGYDDPRREIDVFWGFCCYQRSHESNPLDFLFTKSHVLCLEGLWGAKNLYPLDLVSPTQKEATRNRSCRCFVFQGFTHITCTKARVECSHPTFPWGRLAKTDVKGHEMRVVMTMRERSGEDRGVSFSSKIAAWFMKSSNSLIIPISFFIFNVQPALKLFKNTLGRNRKV